MKEDIEAIAEKYCGNEPEMQTLRDGFIIGYYAANEWVKCSDRLPEELDQCYLVMTTTTGVDMSYFIGDIQNNEFEWPGYEYGQITHWKPLPNQPTT